MFKQVDNARHAVVKALAERGLVLLDEGEHTRARVCIKKIIELLDEEDAPLDFYITHGKEEISQ